MCLDLSDKPFSFLSKDEIEKMRQEEEKKIASLSKEELKSWSCMDEDEDEDNKTVQDDRPGANVNYTAPAIVRYIILIIFIVAYKHELLKFVCSCTHSEYTYDLYGLSRLT